MGVLIGAINVGKEDLRFEHELLLTSPYSHCIRKHLSLKVAHVYKVLIVNSATSSN